MSVVTGNTLPDEPQGTDDGLFDGDSVAFIASLVFHLGLLLALGLVPLLLKNNDQVMTFIAAN